MAGDQFGASVAFSGIRILAGASLQSGPTQFAAGAAYVYRGGPGGWQLEAELTAPQPTFLALFGGAVDLHGAAALVTSRTGAHFFDRTGSGWALAAALAPPGLNVLVNIRGAAALAPSGDTAVAGLLDFGAPVGSVAVYERGPAGWQQTAQLQPAGGFPGDGFGRAADVHGDTAVVGAPTGDGAGAASGSAYVFERGPAGWVQTAELVAGDGAPGDAFGGRVAVWEDRIFVGSVAHVSQGPAGPIRGAVYVYDRTPTGWAPSAVLVASDGDAGSSFGASLSPGADRLLVGAGMNLVTGQPGSAYVLEWTPGGWGETTQVPDPSPTTGNKFGNDLALGEAALAVSADQGSLAGPAAGWVGVFTDPALVASPDQLSLATGGVQSFALDAGSAHAALPYVLVGSLSGTSPGTLLSELWLPLNPDVYTVTSLIAPNSPPLAGSSGTLDAAGRSQATFTLPPGLPPVLLGQVIHHAFAVIELQPTLLQVTFTSEAGSLTLVP